MVTDQIPNGRGGDVLFDPNGWDPTDHDLSAMAELAGVSLNDGTILPMDQTLLQYAASLMEHEGGIGDETYERTVEVYQGLIARANSEADELLQLARDNDPSVDEETALDLAQTETLSELLQTAARAVLARGTGETR